MTFSFIRVVIIKGEIRPKRNTSRNAEEIAEINEIVELKGLGF